MKDQLIEFGKSIAYTALGFFQYHLGRRKRIVVVLSSMRSGSTLLKSLLGQAPDISLLDEFHFIPYARRNKYFFYHLVSRLSDKPIVVLKKPYNNVPEHLELYGKTPLEDALTIVLYRGPYETLLSLKALQARKGYGVFDDERCVKYWCDTYRAILENVAIGPRTLFVRYEDLTTHPRERTEQIFRFLGSSQEAGIGGYGAYDWRSGLDDDSDKIRSGSVQRAEPADPAKDPGLYAEIQQSAEVARLLDRLSRAAAQDAPR